MSNNTISKLVSEWTTARRKVLFKSHPKFFFDELVKVGISTTNPGAKKKLERICSGECDLDEEVLKCLEKVLGEKPKLLAEAMAKRRDEQEDRYAVIDSLFRSFASPKTFIASLNSPELSEAAAAIYRRTMKELDHIRDGRIPLPLDVDGYFKYFVKLIQQNRGAVRVAAQVLPATALEKMKKLRLTERLSDATGCQQLNVEYVICLPNVNSMKDDHVRSVLTLYRTISSKVFVFTKHGATSLSEADISRSIVLLDQRKWVFTHGWDLEGNLHDPVQHLSQSDYTHYEDIYDKLKHQSTLWHGKRA